MTAVTTDPRGQPTVLRPRANTPASQASLPLGPALPVPVTWGGHEVNAPGFDQDRFDRAMARAFVDDLQVKPLGGDAFLVHHPAATRGHRTTRETCSCPAGEHEVPCKHRALVIAHLDIRMPERARRWARRQRRIARQMQEAA
jgi:hypothetical protein